MNRMPYNRSKLADRFIIKTMDELYSKPGYRESIMPLANIKDEDEQERQITNVLNQDKQIIIEKAKSVGLRKARIKDIEKTWDSEDWSNPHTFF